MTAEKSVVVFIEKRLEEKGVEAVVEVVLLIVFIIEHIVSASIVKEEHVVELVLL